jgi:hypothetical protein
LGLEDQTKAGPNERLVVGNQDARAHAGWSSGNRARTA